jgi:two-component system, chemotaxis family, protein-glutamate methylesterase/glutaminase
VNGEKEIKVVVIDDSAFNRQTITSMLESSPGIRVVARAGDGDEGLREVLSQHPHVVTLDLEMPKMDGFTFLRILMNKRPTPVIVISSNGRRDGIFKALELGALDFISKPTQRISPELRDIEVELVQKVRLVSRLRVVSLAERLPQKTGRPSGVVATVDNAATAALATPGPLVSPRALAAGVATDMPLRLCVIGASTGGPPALQQIAQALPRPLDLPIAILVGLHMPAKFTHAFAERIGRTSAWPFREANSGDALLPGTALVAPGGAVTTIARGTDGVLRVRIDPPQAGDHFMPSIDRMFETAAQAAPGKQLLGVVLTGMGGDGARGVRAIRDAGGKVIAESAETAVIFGMPGEAIRTGAVAEVLPLQEIAHAIARFGGA